MSSIAFQEAFDKVKPETDKILKSFVMGTPLKKRILPVEHILKERMKSLDNCQEFQKVFGTRLKPFWINNILGFDVVEFDTWLKVPDGISTMEYIKKRFGKAGVSVIDKLLA